MKRFLQFRLRTYFLAIALGAAALAVGVQQQRINKMQRELDELQGEHEVLRNFIAEHPPVRTLPLAMR